MKNTKKIKIQATAILLVIVLFLVGCGQNSTDAPEQNATSTPTVAVTETPIPTPTNTPVPTATSTPEPTATSTPVPTATYTPAPTATSTPTPTATSTPTPTATSTPTPTATSTPIPTATNTPVPTATYTPAPTATNTPTPTSTPTPTEVPPVDLGYHFVGMLNTTDYYYKDGYIYQYLPIVGEFDETNFTEKVLNECLIKYKVLDKITASHSDVEEGKLLDCYLLEEEITGMICYLDVPSGSGRFGSAETNYLHLIMLTQTEYDNLRSKGLVQKDVNPDKLDKVGGHHYTYTRPVDCRNFENSEFFVVEKYIDNSLQ